MVSTGNEHSRNKPIELNAVPSEEVGNRLYMKSVCADHNVENEVDHEKLLTMSLCEEGQRQSQYKNLVDIIYSEIAAEIANNDISPTYSCPALQSASAGQQTMCDLVENDNYINYYNYFDCYNEFLKMKTFFFFSILFYSTQLLAAYRKT